MFWTTAAAALRPHDYSGCQVLPLATPANFVKLLLLLRLITLLLLLLTTVRGTRLPTGFFSMNRPWDGIGRSTLSS